MSVSKVEMKKFAALVATALLEDKTEAHIQQLSQDAIDAHIIPIMSEVEDIANDVIAKRIKDALDTGPINPDSEWW